MRTFHASQKVILNSWANSAMREHNKAFEKRLKSSMRVGRSKAVENAIVGRMSKLCRSTSLVDV